MKRFLYISTIAAIASVAWVAFADLNSENIAKGKGFLICNGGSGGKALFSDECKQVSITRLTTSGGAIKYEISCTNTNHTTFLLACDVFAFEQK